MYELRPLTPEARLRNPDEPPQGYEVPLMGGALWTLFPVGACCEDAEVSLLQDELYDAIAYEGKFRREVLFRAFESAIRINYDLTPAEKKALAGDEGAEAKLTMYGGMLHLLLFLLLIDMIWKPGL